MHSSDHILGVILAGGRSQRFGGGDKTLASLGGKPLLSHVVEALEPQVGKLILSANGDLDRFQSFGLETVADCEFGEQGPLSGILAAIDYALGENSVFSAVASVTSDTPFLPPDLVGRLDESRGSSVAIATSADRRHPAIAVWPVETRAAIADALAKGAAGVDALATRLNAVAVAFPLRDIGGVLIDPFLNLNTPQDFAAARSLIPEWREK